MAALALLFALHRVPVTPVVTATPSVSIPVGVRAAANRLANLSRKRRPVPKPPVVWRTAVASTYDEPQPLAGPYARYTGVGDPRPVVAHKTLPFGTRVEFRYRGRTCVGVVMDRGPYVSGRDFDLGWAVHEALGIGNTVVTLEYRIMGGN